MKTEEMDARERAFAYALLALSLLAFFSLNLLTRVMRDDYAYTFNFVTKERIASFGDIFQSLGIHYTNVNGRLPVHFFAHLFLWLGKGVFNAVNTAAFAALVTLVYYHGFGALRPFRPYAWLAVFFGFWALTPAFGESFLWVTGASNYLYGLLLILAYLIPFRRLADGEAGCARPALAALAALPGGVLAGWTNENTSCALCFLVLCAIAAAAARKRRVPAWCLTGLAGCAAGLLLMLLAPGELGRLDGAGGMGGARDVLWRAGVVTYKLLRFLWPGVLAWLALLVLFVRRRRAAARLLPAAAFLLAGLGAAYAMAFPPSMPDRVWSAPVAFFLISALLLWRAAGEPRFPGARERVLAVTLCAALALGCYAAGAKKLSATAEAFDARNASAAAQLSSGERDLTLAVVYGSGSRFDAAEAQGDITPDPSHWLNGALARWLGAASVTAKEE